jgi:hypothetical protein
MTPVRRHLVVLVTLVVAAALVTTAAGTGVAAARDANSDLERVKKSGDELAKSGSAKFRGTTTTAGSKAKVVFDGSFDFENRAGEYSVDVASIGLQGSGKVKVLLVGGVMYLSLDALEGGDPSSNPALAGKKWLKLDPQLFGGGGEIGQSNPKGSLDALRGVKSVKRIGSESLRGTTTTRYRATIDAQQAVDNAPEDQRAEVQSSVAALGSGRVPADVWVDGKGRLRKIRLHIAASPATTKGSVAFEYFDLGAGVQVEEPPASEAIDFLEVLGESPPTGSSG